MFEIYLNSGRDKITENQMTRDQDLGSNSSE